MDEANGVLTLDEVATFLRTDPVHVQQLLETGDLAGFKIADEWRILWGAIIDFLRREMEATQRQALSRSLSDPRMWVRELQRKPELIALLGEQEFEDGTMGAFLKDALRTEEQERSAGNVIPFQPKRD